MMRCEPSRAVVTPEHGTETFAEVTFELDGWRWSGTRFRLRTGKALRQDRMDVVVHFRPVPGLPFEISAGSLPNRMHFGLEPEGLTLELTGTGPGVGRSLVPLTLTAEVEPPELPAYGRILLDVLRGNSALSIRADEAEEAWRVARRFWTAGRAASRRSRSTTPGSNGPAADGRQTRTTGRW